MAKLEQAIFNIETATETAAFAIQLITRDQLNGEYYPDEDIFGSYIDGCAYLYTIPRGSILHSKHTKSRFACANIYFMVNKNIIPISKTNIPELCNIKRSDDRIHRGRITWNQSIFPSSTTKKLCVRTTFNDNETQITTPLSFRKNKSTIDNYKKQFDMSTNNSNNDNLSDDDMYEKCYYEEQIHNWGTLQKGMLIKELMEINDIPCLEIYLSTIDINNFSKEDDYELQKEIIDYYNNMLRKWIYESLTKLIVKQDINAVIFLNNIKVFKANII